MQTYRFELTLTAHLLLAFSSYPSGTRRAVCSAPTRSTVT